MRPAFRVLTVMAFAVGVVGCGSEDDSSASSTTDAEADSASGTEAEESPDSGVAAEMAITSKAFADGSPIPSQYTCDGANTQPPLTVEGTPSDAVGLVLIVDDPDAPSGSFIHWVVWDLEPDAVISEGVLPAGATEGTNGTSDTA